jgi:hypothetical protein
VQMVEALGKAKEAELTMDNFQQADALASISQTMAELQTQAAFARRTDAFVGGAPLAHRDVSPPPPVFSFVRRVCERLHSYSYVNECAHRAPRSSGRRGGCSDSIRGGCALGGPALVERTHMELVCGARRVCFLGFASSRRRVSVGLRAR